MTEKPELSRRTLSAKILSFLRIAGTGGGSITPAAWQTFQEEIDSELTSRSGNQQVHHGRKGGILRGHPSYRRKHYEEWDKDKRVACLYFNRRNLSRRGQRPPNEVAYERALFNGVPRSLDVVEAGVTRRVHLIAYEAPLLRKKQNTETDKGNPVRCDLIGLSDDHLLAIELKTEPFKAVTDLPYALLEAFAYGRFLRFHAQDNVELNNEIRMCMAAFQRDNSGIETRARYAIESMVAGPRSYFNAYFMPSDKPTSLRQAELIEGLIASCSSPDCRFSGFLVFDNPVESVRPRDEAQTTDRIVPVFDSAPVVQSYPSLSALQADARARS